MNRQIMSYNLTIASLNSHGCGPDRTMYIKHLLANNDLICVQEHWLHNCMLSKLESLVDARVHGVSGMNDNDLTEGRPYGGVAIIWNKKLTCQITPILLSSQRVCAVKILMSCYLMCICHVIHTMMKVI